MARTRKPCWWKMFLHQRPAIDSISDADVGMGIKAAYAYLDGEAVDETQLTSGARTVFAMMRPNIEESIGDYNQAVANGRYGAEARWRKKA